MTTRMNTQNNNDSRAVSARVGTVNVKITGEI
jgi:hypothetical protein